MDIAKTCMGLGLTATLSMAGLTIRSGGVTAPLFGLVGACACFSYVWLFLTDAQLSAAYVQELLASLWQNRQDLSFLEALDNEQHQLQSVGLL